MNEVYSAIYCATSMEKRNLLFLSVLALHFVRSLAFVANRRPSSLPDRFESRSLSGWGRNGVCLSSQPHLYDKQIPVLTAERNETAVMLPERRQRQVRRKHANRRPKYYWFKKENILQELYDFWLEAGVKIPKSRPPPIPNEVLLIFFERHDLRGAITKQGGRESVSQLLGDAPIVPGRWQEAMQISPETRALVQASPILSLDRPPSVPGTTVKSSQKTAGDSPRWTHQNGRKPKGFWSLQTAVEELYEYVDQYRESCQRPSVWMPRPSEFTQRGRNDLKQAIDRFGGAKKICRLAGMVPYQEWYYFEGQLDLLLELRSYLDDHANGDYSIFPSVQDVKYNGYDNLHSLIQYYGGRKFLAAKLGMKSKSQFQSRDLNWGPFDLDFAIKLLLFVRQRHLKKSPPLRYPVLAIPTQQQLIVSKEGEWLDEKIGQFGGYENVARRLGLAFPMH